MRFLITCCYMLCTCLVQGQLSVSLSIENQYIDGSNFYFDIYIRRTSSPDDLYLGNADFVISFNENNFTGPTLSKEGGLAGFCTFVPTDATSQNNTGTRESYSGRTAVRVDGSLLVINLSGPSVNDQLTFNARVAKIDNTSNHRLGRFRLSGISNPNGTAGLTWRESGAGVTTKVFTLENTPNFVSSEVNDLTANNPANALLPIELSSFKGFEVSIRSIRLVWETLSEYNNDHFILERSKSLLNWLVLGKVNGAGNSEQMQSYEFVDNSPMKGVNFYRLKQVDFDGSSTYSSIINVNLEESEMVIYPNPAFDQINVRKEIGTSFEIFSSHGMKIQEGTINGGPIHLKNLAPNIYFLKTEGDIHKFVIGN